MVSRKRSKSATSSKSPALVIVESPAKARTLAKMLGPGYEIRASLGHVRDLPQHWFGVDIAGGFQPQYVLIPSRRKVVRELRQAAAKAGQIYLAPDPDREGEAIAWHLRELLARNEHDRRFQRITYHEITESAIRQALAVPREIDERMVHAQQARRILDRIVGYRVSPFLQQRIPGAASAGRVQTAALRLVCEREREIRSFQPKEYWIIGVQVAKRCEPRDPFVARLVRIGEEKPEIGSAAEAEAIRKELDERPLRVRSVETKRLKRRPPPPFITSTLQQAASRALGFVPAYTMRVAQALYEGVDLGSGPVGLITYMRTDSVAVAAEAQTACRQFIEQTYGREYVPPRPHVYRSRSSAQEAHEAIRPTDVRRTPESVAPHLKPDEARLYELIWRRFVASQMTPAELRQTQVEIEAVPPTPGERSFVFRAVATEVKFPGYLRVASDVAISSAVPGSEDESESEPEVPRLPPLEAGEPLDRVGDWLAEQKFTQPPRRYTDASLVRAMEERGIGRPSTYASTVQLLYERGYIRRVKRAIYPTELGMKVVEYLVERFPKLFDIGFTADMEQQLDAIEEGRANWRDMLQRFYQSFQEWMESAQGRDPNPDELKQLIELLVQDVQSWDAPAPGRRAFNEQKFVKSLREQIAAGRPVTERQGQVLRRIAWKYRDQVPEVVPLLLRLGWSEPAGTSRPPSERTAADVQQLLDRLADVQFDPPRKVRGRTWDDKKFYESLRAQVAAGRALTDAQVKALEQLARRYGRLPSSSGGSVAEDPMTPEETQAIEEMFRVVREVREWKTPPERRGLIKDDRAFVESLEQQFRRSGRLSPKQVAALRRLVQRYSGTATSSEPTETNAS